MSDQERAAYGWLGKPPHEIMMAPAPIVKKWKRLNTRARQVANMRYSENKIHAAKQVERERNELIAEAKGHLSEQQHDQG